MLSTLRERIHDGRFIHLIQEFLKAGYMEDWTFNETLSGKGGIVSPILANIYLDKLDRFVETSLIPEYTRGAKRRNNRAYGRLLKKASELRKRGKFEEAEAVRKQAQQLPSVDTQDPYFRRLRYVQYADDFLLGFIGTKAEAEEIKQRLEVFLREELKNAYHPHAKGETARFLGYEVTIAQRDTKQTQRHTLGREQPTMCRSVNGQVTLRVPQTVVEETKNRYKKNGKVMHRPELERLSDYEIILIYQLQYRGIANYYQMAQNQRSLNTMKWVMETSLTKTLAHKHKMSVKQVYRKYGATHQANGKPYKGLAAYVLREGKEPLVAKWGGIPLKRNVEVVLDDQPPQFYSGRSELEKRLLAQICETCGSTEKLEVHHIRAMKDLHKYPGREKPLWMQRMIARKRKTMIVCRTCHEDITFGRPFRRQPISLEEVKALQKEATLQY